jgi:hypothetical protein
MVVQLGAGFSPASIQLGVGQQFLLLVSPHVQVTWTSVAGACTPGMTAQVAGGLLEVQCTADGSGLYTAERPGSTTLTAMVRPSCAPGVMCPQWIALASLKVTVT